MKKEDPSNPSNIIQLPSGQERKAWEKERLKPANDVYTPARKREPFLKLPVATKSLAALLVAAFAALQFMDEALRQEWIYKLGFVPARYTGGTPAGIDMLISPLSCLFLHASWLHLAVNTLSLMAFGAGVEKALGARKMILCFLLTGLLSLPAQMLLATNADAPLVGASGAISGLFGALLIRLQEQGYLRPGWRGLAPIIALWLGMNLFFGFFGVPGNSMDIAWIVHAAGFVAGLFIYPRLRKTKSIRHM